MVKRKKIKWAPIFIAAGLIVILILVKMDQKKEVVKIKENIDISQLKIDHLVIQVDEKYQAENKYIDDIRNIGLPYQPQKGKETSGFKVSNIWMGKEYFELVRIKETDGGGWIPEWTKRYNEGERGMICLFLDTDNISYLYTKLQNLGMTEPEKLKYKFFFNLFSFSPPWKNAYLPYFEGAPFQIGFQQMDAEKTKENMYKKMRPNSSENKITGIKKIEIYGNFSKEDRQFIYELFKTEGDVNEGTLTWSLNNQQTISFINDTKYKVKVYVDNQNEQIASGSSTIENVEVIVEAKNLDKK